MNIKYEITICDECSEEEEITPRIIEHREILKATLNRENYSLDYWTRLLKENKDKDFIKESIEIFKQQFQKKCIIFQDEEGPRIILCEEHFKELLKGFKL